MPKWPSEAESGELYRLLRPARELSSFNVHLYEITRQGETLNKIVDC